MPSSSPHEVRPNLMAQQKAKTGENMHNNYYLQQKTHNGRPGSGLSISVLGRINVLFIILINC